MKKEFVHEDYFNSKGEQIPSVTTILKILSKEQLYEWHNFMGFLKINTKEYTKRAALIGTLTHYFLERSGKKKLINYSILDEYDEKIYVPVRKAIKGYVKWYKEYNPNILKCETKVSNEQFGGTIDNICEISNELYIVDYKTSKDVYPSMFLQLAAYNKLLREEMDYKVDYVAILILNKKKVEYKFIKMKVSYLEKYYEPVFILMYEVYIKWKENLKVDWNQEL